MLSKSLNLLLFQETFHSLNAIMLQTNAWLGQRRTSATLYVNAKSYQDSRDFLVVSR